MDLTSPDLAALLPSWRVALTAEHKSPGTIRTYTDGVKKFLRWCADTGQPAELSRSNVQAFLAYLIGDGQEGNTARSRDLALKRFAAWLLDEGEITANPLIGLKPPRADQKVVHALTDDELKRLIRACQGKSLVDRRDEAIVRLMLEAGLRAGEVVGLQVSDVDISRGLVTITRVKGGKGRVAPFGPQTAQALDRYLRVRRSHRLADAGALWVGGGGKRFRYFGLNAALKIRAEAAGIEGFHLHVMRHTAATRWLRAGGSEQGLMSVAGWQTRSMLDRYTSASASERAAEESRKLNLGDL
ncbi:MAG TPA: tyrosine-type recombinase/integrase [Mycobacterium sp.]|jgi:site-specific recombinase XerD|uniref:tyrosine-type recombinase/integrase n=1 Tax=Mycobacterium sp. TaxID=1785 RepID=UPI002F4287C8